MDGTADFRQEVIDFYTAYNPDKIDEVQQCLPSTEKSAQTPPSFPFRRFFRSFH
jgi:hypothetical protein